MFFEFGVLDFAGRFFESGILDLLEGLLLFAGFSEYGVLDFAVRLKG
ncbi:hypothetical protein Patl1_21510 [Pistacia atlantica]|uniref:Uncharacterized protein n=1 Tax=Pistacia atlantica TaxID=434234 RepID=A0ACC1BMZ0_9ROSI|nr:hypothetical protein Patl1_21510 [Pistacia atlantica]